MDVFLVSTTYTVKVDFICFQTFIGFLQNNLAFYPPIRVFENPLEFLSLECQPRRNKETKDKETNFRINNIPC